MRKKIVLHHCIISKVLEHYHVIYQQTLAPLFALMTWISIFRIEQKIASYFRLINYLNLHTDLRIYILVLGQNLIPCWLQREGVLINVITYLYWVLGVHGLIALTTMNTCWNWDRILFGVNGWASGSWNTIVTMSLPMCLFLNNCWRLLGVKGSIVETWNMISQSWWCA